eukprot:351469-Chlamydomonas_euryale.AAC.5
MCFGRAALTHSVAPGRTWRRAVRYAARSLPLYAGATATAGAAAAAAAAVAAARRKAFAAQAARSADLGCSCSELVSQSRARLAACRSQPVTARPSSSMPCSLHRLNARMQRAWVGRVHSRSGEATGRRLRPLRIAPEGPALTPHNSRRGEQV